MTKLKPGNRGGPMGKPRKAGMTKQGFAAVANKKSARGIKHEQHSQSLNCKVCGRLYRVGDYYEHTKTLAHIKAVRR